MKKSYANDRIIIHWDSDKCIGAGYCDGQLPGVFNPKRRPWVDVNAADADAIKKTIECCPTGALTYEVPGETGAGTGAATIYVLPGGPYKVCGKCCLIGEQGEVIETCGTFALCRCGLSKNVPFCDGSHSQKKTKNKPTSRE